MQTSITVALAGNPNSGKTTLFNNLTGSRQHVGNYPGITVEQKEGYRLHSGQGIRLSWQPLLSDSSSILNAGLPLSSLE